MQVCQRRHQKAYKPCAESHTNDVSFTRRQQGAQNVHTMRARLRRAATRNESVDDQRVATMTSAHATPLQVGERNAPSSDAVPHGCDQRGQRDTIGERRVKAIDADDEPRGSRRKSARRSRVKYRTASTLHSGDHRATSRDEGQGEYGALTAIIRRGQRGF